MINFPDYRFYFDIEEDGKITRYMRWDMFVRIRDIPKYRKIQKIDQLAFYEDLGDYLEILKRNYMLVRKDMEE